MIHVPEEIAPAEGELAALSMLAVRDGSSWTLVSGSLLTVPAVAQMSWKRWSELQPRAHPVLDHQGRLDLGPVFCAEPFATSARSGRSPTRRGGAA